VRRPDYQQRNSGFTLVELLIVVVILGILASIVVFAISNTTQDAAVTACHSDYKTVELAQEAYRGQIGTSATSFTDLEKTAVGPDHNVYGPWLKDTPGNTSQYIISFDSTPGATQGDVQVASVNPVHAAQDGNANCVYA
jgi:prepilin-type N-terminal cleavage/methylation domain-containing protein